MHSEKALSRASRTFVGGKVVMTAGIAALSNEERQAVIDRVRAFDAFTSDNDPHGEHDFGSFDHSGQRIVWKIDCYDREMEYGSPDPADPHVTKRILTIMLASQY